MIKFNKQNNSDNLLKNFIRIISSVKRIPAFKFRSALVAVIFIMLTFCNQPSQAQWQNVGIPGFSAGGADYISLAFSNNTPYVAYCDRVNGLKASVMKFDGTNWVNVGIPGFSANFAFYESLAFDGNTPYAAYQDYSNGAKATVMKFNGSVWKNVGKPGFSEGLSEYICLEFDVNTPYVAYCDNSVNNGTTVMKFDGTEWVNVGNAGFSGGFSAYINLAFQNNIPYVSYFDGANGYKATVMKFNGVDWVLVGNAGFSAGETGYNSLAFDGSIPYVAYSDDIYGDRTTVMKFDGVNWVNVGTPGFSDGPAYFQSLVIYSGTPYVAYCEHTVNKGKTVMKFDGVNWVNVGAPGFSTGISAYSSLAFNGSIPYVAYSDGENGRRTSLLKCLPLNGTYTIGTGGDYPTISTAVIDITTLGISGPVNFKIKNGTYDEQITVNSIPGTSSINPVTFESESGIASDVIINGGGHLGVFNIVGSSNLIIQKLTIINTDAVGIYLRNQLSDIKILDNIFNTGLFSIYTPDNGSSLDHIVITGNTDIAWIYLYNGSINNIIISNNNFKSNRSSINISNVQNASIEKNRVNQVEVYGQDVKISNNKITNLGSLYGYAPFKFLGSHALIINNFIKALSPEQAVEIYGDDINFKFNTVIGGGAGGSGFMTIIYRSGGTNFLSNNIFINPSGGNVFLRAYFSADFLNSDYNDFYNGGNSDLINYAGASYNTVNDFFNATGLDQHSNSHPVNFQSPTDLHLAGTSIGDEQLAGIPNASVTDDIDGNPRNPLHPYKGADEVTDYPLPIELASFTSSVSNNNVNLKWTTASETNNSGFDLERRDARSETQDVWNKISFINGHGTTASLNNYEFTDKNLSSGKYKYRLKQIDFNGNFEYHNLNDEVMIGVPEKFELSQNYPNPFNPTTVISYSLSENSFVTLKVYDVIGNEVATLVSEKQNSGTYNYQFSTVNYQLSSGVYFYKIVAGSFSAVKRMILIK